MSFYKTWQLSTKQGWFNKSYLEQILQRRQSLVNNHTEEKCSPVNRIKLTNNCSLQAITQDLSPSPLFQHILTREDATLDPALAHKYLTVHISAHYHLQSIPCILHVHNLISITFLMASPCRERKLHCIKRKTKAYLNINNYLMKKEKSITSSNKSSSRQSCSVDARESKLDFVKTYYAFTSFSTEEPSAINDSNKNWEGSKASLPLSK